MKIAVYGATGMIGSSIATEALSRGHEVTAISRRGDAGPDGSTAEQGDMGDAAGVRDVAGRHDVIVTATGPSRTGGSHEPWLAAIQTLIDNAEAARVLVVGGAGSLLPGPNGPRLLDLEAFPAAYRQEAITGAASLDAFRTAPDSLDWTYLSPAPEIAPGERTGHYTVGTDQLVGDRISVEDYAVAMVDEIEQRQHPRTRFTVAS